jgi:cytochrome c oxidase assembly protein subunit 15
VLLACATFRLIWIGGEVTTYNAGMAVPDWPTTYGYNPFLYPIETWVYGPWDLFIEHGHRLFASLVGLVVIALCASLWLTKASRGLKALGLLALAGVIFQGVLGGMRVRLDERTLAMIHGCFGPLFLAFTAALAVVTSKRWHELAGSIDVGPTRALSFMVLGLPLVAYLQLILGAQVRHHTIDQRPDIFQSHVVSHVVLGVTLALLVLATTVVIWRKSPQSMALVRPATLLSGLVLVQILLGAATWISKYGWPAFLSDSASAATFTVQADGWRQAQITTAHVATGSLILAISTVLALRTVRFVKPQPSAPRFAQSLTSQAA